MSWYGTHPVRSKAVARRFLPAGACRHCVHLMRMPNSVKNRPFVFIRNIRGEDTRRCSGCGIHADAFKALNEPDPRDLAEALKVMEERAQWVKENPLKWASWMEHES